MATFEITGPDGKTMELTTPDGATNDMIRTKVEELKSNWGTLTQQKTSATGAFLTGLGQSVFGLGDEIEAGARAAYDAATTDKTFGSSYDENLAAVRDRVDASAKEHPVAYYGGEIGGMFAVPMGVARGVAAGAARVPGVAQALTNLGQRVGIAGTGLASRMGSGAASGAAYGGAYGFGMSEGGVQNRLEGAAGGSMIGGAFGGAAPAVLAGISAAARPVRNAVASALTPEREAARRILEAQTSGQQAQAAANRVLGPQNQARDQEVINLLQSGRAGDELRNIDAIAGGGEPVRALARSAANNSPEARQVLNRMTNDRFEGQTPRVAEFVRGLIPQNELVSGAGNASLTQEAVAQLARNANRGAYRTAFHAGDREIWTPEIENLISSDIFKDAMKAAVSRGKDRAVIEGYGGFNPGVRFENGTLSFPKGPNGVPTYPNLQYWDAVKRQLDAIGGKAARSGDNALASDAGAMARRLREHLDTIVPEYGAARGQAANYFNVENALEAGQMFARQGRHDVAAVGRMVQRMNPQEQRLFREGFVSDFLHNIEANPDRRNIVARIANSTAERAKLDIALGPRRARELEAFMYVENIMDLPRLAMGNSTTARQLVELGLAGGAGMLASGGNILDPKALTIAALTFGARRGQVALNERMARNIAEMLVSQNPQAMRRAVQSVARVPGVIDNLRALMGRLGDAAIPASGAAVGGYMSQGSPPLHGTITRQDVLEAQRRQ